MDNYYRSKEFKEILAQYENLSEDNFSSMLSTDDYSNIAQYYHETGDDNKALQAIDTALSIYPGSVGPISFLSRYALLEENNIKKALDIADEIEDKNDPDYILLQAEIMVVDGHPDDADEYLEDAYQKFYDDDYYDDMPLDVAMLFVDYEEMDYAEKWLGRSDETDADEYICTKAKLLINNGDYKQGEELVNKLINKDPYSTTYWDLLAAVQSLAGNVSESMKSSDFALAIDPDDRDALLNKANGLMALENYKEAEKIFHHFTRLESKKFTGYSMLGVSLIAQERYQEALGYFVKALKVNEEDPHGTWVNNIDILFQMSYLENTLEHFGKVHEYLDRIADIEKEHLADNLDELGNHLAELDCAHGHVYLEEDKIDDALEWFDQAVTDSNGKPSIYVKIAASSYECGYVQYAYNILHELLYNQGVEDKLGYDYLALCCKHLGKDDEMKWAEERTDENKKSAGEQNRSRLID